MILMTLAVNMVLVRVVRVVVLLPLLMLMLLADRRLEDAEHEVLVGRDDPGQLPALPEQRLLFTAVHPAPDSSSLQVESWIPFVSPSSRAAT